MIDQDEPQRLCENPEAPPGLRGLLVQAQEDLPTAVEKQQLIAAAMGRGTVERPPIHGRGSGMRWAAKAARRSTRLWSIAAVVGVGAGALYVAGLVRHPSSNGNVPQMATKSAPHESPEGAPGPERRAAVEVEPLAAGATPMANGGAELGEQSAPTFASGDVAMVPAAPILRAAPRLRPRRAIAMTWDPSGPRIRQGRGGETAASPRTSAPAPLVREAPPAPPPGSAAVAQPQPQPAVTTTGAGPAPRLPQDPVADPSGAEEASLLRSARQALPRSPGRTLALTNEHRRRYPHGILDQEREALAIEALIKLGRVDEAQPRAQAFAVAYPASPHRARLERALRPSSSRSPSLGADAAP